MNEPKNKDWTTGLAVAGLAIGAGLLGATLWQASEQRQRFRQDLASALLARGLDYVSAELGRRANDIPVWHVTVQHPTRGIYSLSVAFQGDTDPYSTETLERLVQRIVRHLNKRMA